MAPFYQAVTVRQDRIIGGVEVYVSAVDPEWTVASVPNGGYVLALILDACIKRQASTVHPDPIHVTAHFLTATAFSAFEIHVKIIKIGRTFTNIQADFVQNGTTGISSHLIFGVLKPPTSTGKQLTLAPSSPYARRVPLHRHPSNAPLDNNWHSIYNFRSRINTTVEPEIVASIAPDSPARTDSNTIGGGGIDWGIWCGFKDKDERLTTQALAFFADLFTNGPMLLPDENNNGTRKSWYPTIVMTVEFKFPISPPSNDHADRTVGLFSTSKFINDPYGRHDQYTEVWTAPCNIGEGKEVDGWRDKQVCLATSTQMALTLPMAANFANKKRSTKSSKL